MRSAHITLIQVRPFLEPVFAPDQLQSIGRWQRLQTRVDGPETIKNRRTQSHLELFTRRDSLRSWIRYGYPIAVPNVGVMRPLRSPDIPYDRFYSPFFQKNARRVEKWWQKVNGPMPFYPIQVLPSAFGHFHMH